jgi:transposase
VDAQKKSLSAVEQDAARRQAWWTEAAAVDPTRFVFLDECGAHLAHTRAYARAPRGARATGRVPRNRGAVTTVLASLTPTGVGPTQTLSGGTTKEVFLSYLTDELGPTLEPGQIVVLDNLGAHRATAVRAAVEARGAALLYLPAYSPDFNPIELVFGTLKTALRRAGARTREGLETAIRTALAAITPTQARAYFAHCGYHLPDQDFRLP